MHITIIFFLLGDGSTENLTKVSNTLAVPLGEYDNNKMHRHLPLTTNFKGCFQLQKDGLLEEYLP